jgi:uncharacterized protein (DUF305 family)
MLVSPMLASAHEKTAMPPPASSSAAPMDHSRMGHMDAHAGMAMTGDVDYDFAVNMRKHHQMALMMSEAQLKNGKNAKLRAMATQIIAAQKKEIAELDRWIATRNRAKASYSAIRLRCARSEQRRPIKRAAEQTS